MTITRPTLGRLTLVELRKMTDTRAGFWLLVSTVLLTIGVAVVACIVMRGEDLNLLDVLAVTVQPANVLMPVVGVLLVTSEWSQRTAMVSFALVPQRGRVLAAKVLAGTVLAVLATAVCAVVALVANASFGGTGSVSLALWGQALFTLVTAMIVGVAFGALLLASAPAIVLYFVLPTVWAALGSIAALEGAARWLDQAHTLTPLLETSLSGTQWARVGTSLALWMLLPLAVGAWRIARSDPR